MEKSRDNRRPSRLAEVSRQHGKLRHISFGVDLSPGRPVFPVFRPGLRVGLDAAIFCRGTPLGLSRNGGTIGAGLQGGSRQKPVANPVIPSILLVEDSQDDAYFFQRALRRTCVACSVKHVLTGREASEALTTAEARDAKLPDLVFLDLKMPVMSGFEFLEWLQQQPFVSSLKVVVLSGSNQQDDRQRAQALGAKDYLVKPISSEELAARLHEGGQTKKEDKN